jgi:acyl carrier protein
MYSLNELKRDDFGFTGEVQRMTDTEAEIQRFILSELVPYEPSSRLSEDTALVESGILDSISSLQLVDFLETRFNIEIKADEAGIHNFGCLRDIGALVDHKLSGKTL